MTSPVFTPLQMFYSTSGLPLTDGYIYIGTASQNPQTNPIAVYWDAAGTIPAAQPIRTSGGYPVRNGSPATVFVLATDFSLIVRDKSSKLVFSRLSGNAFSAEWVTYTPAGTGAVATTVQDKLRESVSIEDFGGAAGAGDNTAAMNAAATYLNGLGGGVILIPYVGNWLMNWVCLYNNITVQGVGGDGEYSTTVIRPYNISSAAITFGDGTTIVRYCGLQYVHISGTDGTVSGQTLVANNAPHALRLRGGVINFTADRVVLYNGVKSLSLEPSATQPVTGVRFNNGTIRNDIANSANARCIYMVRFADPGYCTDNKINQTKVNSTTIGYAAEIDGSAVGIAFEVSNSYWDIKPGYGVLLKGASQLIGFNTQLDPGALGAIVIEADSNGDISRFIVGYFRNGGQKFKTPLYTWTLPVEADTFSYKARLNTPYLSPLVFLSQQEDPYNETVFFDRTSTSNTAPVRLNGADFYVAKDVYGYGGNGSTAWYLAANSAGGGAYLAALGTNQNIRLVPSGTGSNIMAGAGTYPSGDNTQPLGLASGRWSVVYAGTGTINTSDAREKQQIRSLSDAENAVAVRLKSLIKAFKFSDAVQAKGDAARIHVGVIAQEVIAAFEAEGLDANRYAIVCYDEWEAQAEEFVPEVIDEHGQVISPCRHTPAIPAGNRYGVRYEELLAFIISAL